jgi:hypothetical protein
MARDCGMYEHCIGSPGSQRAIVLEEEKVVVVMVNTRLKVAL